MLRFTASTSDKFESEGVHFSQLVETLHYCEEPLHRAQAQASERLHNFLEHGVHSHLSGQSSRESRKDK